MINVQTLFLASLLLPLSATSAPWTESLAGMPLDSTQPLNRTNFINRVLAAFQPASPVKGLLFLPDVANTLYLVERDAAPWHIRAANLQEAITTLTNVSPILATFHPPFLLIHTPRDRLVPHIRVRSDTVADRLQAASHPRRTYVDRHWRSVQPELHAAFPTRVRPKPDSEDAWHFARLNLAFGNVSHWEALSALALASDTSVVVRRFSIRFERGPWPVP